jgi:hypothetical protein
LFEAEATKIKGIVQAGAEVYVLSSVIETLTPGELS